MTRAKKGKTKKSDALSGSGEISLQDEGRLSASIGALLGGKGVEPAEKSPAPEAGKEANSAMDVSAYLKSLRQATLHRESAGRGGRVVTAVSCSPAPPPRLGGELARAMRKGLGCGSHVEGEKIILQGDIQERAGAWLTKQGVRKVVMGN